jgi:hypothetical protein
MAASFLTLRISAVRQQLAACPAYQAWIGASSPAAAFLKTYAYGFPGGALGPLAMIDLTTTLSLERRTLTGANPMSWSGDLLLYFISPIPEALVADPTLAGDSHYGPVGNILAELAALPHQPGHLPILSISLWGTERPSDEDAAAQGHYYESAWILSTSKGAL